jgi:hypothetical protein
MWGCTNSLQRLRRDLYSHGTEFGAVWAVCSARYQGQTLLVSAASDGSVRCGLTSCLGGSKVRNVPLLELCKVHSVRIECPPVSAAGGGQGSSSSSGSSGSSSVSSGSVSINLTVTNASTGASADADADADTDAQLVLHMRHSARAVYPGTADEAKLLDTNARAMQSMDCLEFVLSRSSSSLDKVVDSNTCGTTNEARGEELMNFEDDIGDGAAVCTSKKQTARSHSLKSAQKISKAKAKSAENSQETPTSLCLVAYGNACGLVRVQSVDVMRALYKPYSV